MRYIFLTRGYHPHPSPSGSLIRNVIEVLAQVEDVVVLTFAPLATAPSREQCDGYEIVRIPIRETRGQRLLGRLNRLHSPILRRAIPYLSLAQRALHYFVTLMVPDRGKTSRKQIVANLQLMDLHPEDVLIPCTAEEMIACLEFREQRLVRLLPFMLELLPMPNAPNSCIRSLVRRHVRRNDRIERGLIRNSDRIYALPTVHRHLSDKHHGAQAKLILTEHPKLRDLGPPLMRLGDGIDRLVYAGALDRTTRNPTYMLDVFNHLLAGTVVDVNLYSYGNCEALIREPRYANFVHAHGRVSPDVAIDAMRHADFLVTQGNDSENVTPSKLFDCMSTGRPIIHFYYRDSDPYLKYLARYGLGHAVRIGSDMVESASSLRDFMDASRGTRVDYMSLKRTFPECTPAHFSDALRQAHREICSDV